MAIVATSCSGRGARPEHAAPEPAAAMAPELRELLTRGSALNLAGEQDSAFAVYRSALDKWPNEYYVHSGLGTILDLTGRFAEARHHWARAIAVASPQQAPGAHQQLAISYAFECRAADAARTEQAAIDAHLARRDFSAAATVYNEQARIFLECDDAERALLWYRRGYETVLKALGLSDTAQSLWAFRWAHAQARVAARQGRPAAAQQHVAAAQAILARGLNPDQLPFFPYLTGYVAFYAGDYQQAIAELQHASQTDPFVLALLARSHEMRGEDAEAQLNWAKARAINAHGLTVAFARRLAAKP